jgi:hypothetical protein
MQYQTMFESSININIDCKNKLVRFRCAYLLCKYVFALNTIGLGGQCLPIFLHNGAIHIGIHTHIRITLHTYMKPDVSFLGWNCRYMKNRHRSREIRNGPTWPVTKNHIGNELY